MNIFYYITKLVVLLFLIKTVCATKKWPFKSPSVKITKHNDPTPILTYKLNYFRTKILNDKKELNICVRGKNWKFSNTEKYGLAKTSYLMVKDVISHLDKYIPKRTLKFISDQKVKKKNADCFAIVDFSHHPIMIDGMYAYTKFNDHIIIKEIGRLNNPLIWYKVLAHEMGHVFCLNDDYYGGLSMMNNRVDFTNQMIYSRDVSSLNKVFEYAYSKVSSRQRRNINNDTSNEIDDDYDDMEISTDDDTSIEDFNIELQKSEAIRNFDQAFGKY